MVKSTTFRGLLSVKEGMRTIEMDVIHLTTVEEANQDSQQVMGFRFLYDRTAKGEVIEFVKAGRLAKRDLECIKAFEVEEVVGNWCFAPKRFLIPEGEASISKTVELGRETSRSLDRWARALS